MTGHDHLDTWSTNGITYRVDRCRRSGDILIHREGRTAALGCIRRYEVPQLVPRISWDIEFILATTSEMRGALCRAAVAIVRRADAWGLITVADRTYQVGSLPRYPLCVWDDSDLILRINDPYDAGETWSQLGQTHSAAWRAKFSQLARGLWVSRPRATTGATR